MASGKNSGLNEQVCVESPCLRCSQPFCCHIAEVGREESSLESVGLKSVSGLTVAISHSVSPAIPLTGLSYVLCSEAGSVPVTLTGSPGFLPGCSVGLNTFLGKLP